jgi:hypothetical protein
VETRLTFRQKWEALNDSDRNEFLRSAGVRAVVNREGLVSADHCEGPLTPFVVARMANIDKPNLHAMVFLGGLVDMLGRAAGGLTAEIRAP